MEIFFIKNNFYACNLGKKKKKKKKKKKNLNKEYCNYVDQIKLNKLISWKKKKKTGLRLVWFYGISFIIGYLMPNPLYTYILNMYDFVWLGFMAYQPL